MPAVLSYSPPGSDERKSFSLMLRYSQAYDEKKKEYKRVRDYYLGKQKTFLDKKEGEPDDNVVVNLTRTIIDRTLQLLFPTMPVFSLDPLNPNQTEEEKWLETLWKENKGLSKVLNIGLSGSFGGNCYVRVLPVAKGKEFPRLINIPPNQIRPFWRADDIETVVWFEQYFEIGDTETIIDFVNKGTHWKILTYTRESGSNWNEPVEEHWGYEDGPIVSWPHIPLVDSFYGLSEEPSLLLNDKINLILSEIARIVRFHAYPQTVGIGLEADEIKRTDIDGFWTTTNENAKIFHLEMAAPGYALVSSLLDFLMSAKLSTARSVVLKGQIAEFQRVTNAGIRTAFMDALGKNEVLKSTYGTGLVVLCQTAARVAGRPLSSIPMVVWHDPLPVDDNEAVKVAATELEMKIASRAEIAKRRGFNLIEQFLQMKDEALILSEIEKLRSPQVNKEKEDATVTT